MFRHVNPDIWRWVGLALMSGAIPLDGRTGPRWDALCRALELPGWTSDVEVAAELARFKQHGKTRT